MKNKELRIKGFTLIELLVVVAIIGTLVGLLLPQFQNYNKTQMLQNAASQFLSNLRTVQNNAIAGVECSPGLKALGWYLRVVDSTHYQVTSTCADSPISGTGTTYTLPAGVQFCKVYLLDKDNESCPDLPDSPDDVICETPDDFAALFSNIKGEVTLQSGDTDCPVSSSRVKMKFLLNLQSDTSKTANVIIEKGGSIYLQE